MSRKLTSQRKLLGRWVGWFFAWNALLIFMVGLSYIPVMPGYFELPLLNFSGSVLGVSFAALAFVGQSALFAFSGGLLVYLSVLCLPKRWFAWSISIVLASLLLISLITDAVIYHLYHYHLATLFWNIVVSGAFAQIILLSLPERWNFVMIVLGVVSLESLLAYWVWIPLQTNRVKQCGRWIVMLMSVCLLGAYGLYFTARYITTHPKVASIEAQVDAHLIMTEAQTVPYFTYLFQNLVNINDAFYSINSSQNQPLHYPLKPIKANAPIHPYNIVIIAIDSWRYDMMNGSVTPNIASFARHSINFTDNYSGGNATQPGIFSLFYSLPSTYWSAMLNQNRGPVFIRQLLKEHYQLGIFGSAELNFPPFNKTVFRDVPNLQVYTLGNDPAKRDANITKEFNQFVNHRKKDQPFFGFLFYDAVHGYCEEGTHFPKPFQPAASQCNRMNLSNTTNPIPYLNRYKNAVLYDDSLVGQVLKNLKSQKLLKNTIVIITADHGEEFNDEHLDYWGHASAFDPYQVRTPLIVYWPNRVPKTIYYRTSHYDIVPTLMRKALGVTTSMAAYSIGHSLFSDAPLPYLIVGSYENYAILQANRTTIIYPGGNYDITRPDGYSLEGAKLNPILMRRVYDALNK